MYVNGFIFFDFNGATKVDVFYKGYKYTFKEL